MADSAIEWTDRVWNPVVGCSRVSPGCEHCYAETMARRLATMPHTRELYSGLTTIGKKGARWTGVVRTVPERLADPLGWHKPARVFVNSMSDLFHEDVPNEYIAAVFGVMAATPRHTYQVLTKRAERLPEWFRWLEGDGYRHYARIDHGSQIAASRAAVAHGMSPNVCGYDTVNGTSRWRWPLPNVHLGVSCEDQQRADERIPYLLAAPATVRWVSAEPLLGPIDLTRVDAFHVPPWDASLPGEPKTFLNVLTGQGLRPSLAGVSIESTLAARISWVVVGGESGQRARPCDLAWVRSIVEQCKAADVPAFVKQLGARPFVAGTPCGAAGCATFCPHSVGGLVFKHSKAGDPAEWPEDLRVREMPR